MKFSGFCLNNKKYEKRFHIIWIVALTIMGSFNLLLRSAKCGCMLDSGYIHIIFSQILFFIAFYNRSTTTTFFYVTMIPWLCRVRYFLSIRSNKSFGKSQLGLLKNLVGHSFKSRAGWQAQNHESVSGLCKLPYACFYLGF